MLGTTKGAEVALRLNVGSGETLADWRIASGSYEKFLLPVGLPPLPPGHSVTAVQRGCGAEAESNSLPIANFTDGPRLPVPEIRERPQPGDTTVKASVIPGAFVHVTVDGSRYAPSGLLWSGEADTDIDIITIDLAEPLPAGKEIRVVQSLCGRDASPSDEPGAVVDPYTIALFAQPPALIRGTPMNLRIECRDTDTCDLNFANSWRLEALNLDDQAHPCGATRLFNITADDPRSEIVATLRGTHHLRPARLVVPIVPPPPPTLSSYALRLAVEPDSFFTSNNSLVFVWGVEWTVTPSWIIPPVTIYDVGVDNFGSVLLPSYEDVVSPAVSVSGIIIFRDARTFDWTFHKGLTGRMALSPRAISCNMSWDVKFDYTKSGIKWRMEQSSPTG